MSTKKDLRYFSSWWFHIWFHPISKKTFVKLDHLLKNRVENSQNIWVATTKFWKLWGFKGENGLKLVTNKTTSIVGEKKQKQCHFSSKISYVEKMGGFSINTRCRNPDQWSVQKEIFIDLDSRGTPPTSTRGTRQLFFCPFEKKWIFFELQSSTSQGRPNTKKHLGIPQNGLTNHLDVHRRNYPCFGPPKKKPLKVWSLRVYL